VLPGTVLPEVGGPGAASLTTLSPEMQQQIMLQQQAFAAALAGGASGMTGLQIALPPGVTLEQASMMGLPIMALPVQLPSSSGAAPGVAAAATTLPLAPAVLPRVGGGPGMLPAAGLPGLPPAIPRPASSAGGDKLSDGDEFTATGRRKRKDTGESFPVLYCSSPCLRQSSSSRAPPGGLFNGAAQASSGSSRAAGLMTRSGCSWRRCSYMAGGTGAEARLVDGFR
jgi:hypothetical protein